jgi:hypothetical protein
MDYEVEFKRTGETFEERAGKGDVFSSAIGRIALNFSDLEDQVSTAIIKLLKLEEKTGDIVTAEMSFKNKLHMMAALVRHFIPTIQFNTGENNPDEELSELIKFCTKSEQLRNQIMHSSWVGPYLWDAKAQRLKKSAKSKKGLCVKIEDVDAAYLLDIADYIICAATAVEEFFLMIEPKVP